MGQARLDAVVRPSILPRHRKLELRVLEIVWRQGPMSTREVMESLTDNPRPAYFTVRSTMDQLRSRRAIRLARTVRGSQIFEAVAHPDILRDRLIDDFSEFFADDMQSVFARLIQTGRLNLDDLQEAAARLGLSNEDA